MNGNKFSDGSLEWKPLRVVGAHGMKCVLQAGIVAYHQFAALSSHLNVHFASGQTAVSIFFILSGLLAGISLTQRRERYAIARPAEFSMDAISFILRRWLPVILSVIVLIPLYRVTPANVAKPGFGVAPEPFFNTWLLGWLQIPSLFLPNTTLWFVSNLLLFWLISPLMAAALRYLTLWSCCLAFVALCVLDQVLWWQMPLPGNNWMLWESLYISPWTHVLRYTCGLALGLCLSRLALKRTPPPLTVYTLEAAGSPHSTSTSATPVGKMITSKSTKACLIRAIITDLASLSFVIWSVWLLDRSSKRSLRKGFPQSDWRFGCDIPALLLLALLSFEDSARQSCTGRFLTGRWFRKVSPQGTTFAVYILHWNWNSIFIGQSHDSRTPVLPLLTLWPIAFLFDRFIHTPISNMTSKLCLIFL